MEHQGVTIQATDLQEDRYSRFRLIGWWDQERLRNANALVIGAGALGNEILKNLALLGVGKILIIDLDQIEYSNLSRSVLFRPEDVGKSKAKTAAKAVADILGDGIVHAIDANILNEIGLGIFGWADVVIAGLDNREARLWINRCAWKMNRPWIDGAIEGVNGVARVFLPGKAPCYECTLGETDWAILEKRMSCNLLTKEEMLGGKTPTTPTISSIIAGVEVQEAVKLLHGLPVIAGKGYQFEGLYHRSYLVEYSENRDCLSHETYTRLTEFPGASTETTLSALYAFASDILQGEEPLTLEFSRDVIRELHCPQCNTSEEYSVPVGTLSAKEGRCPKCDTMREVITAHQFTGCEPYGDKTVREMGLPMLDVFGARRGNNECQILIAGDREGALGPLAPFKPTIWEQVKTKYPDEE